LNAPRMNGLALAHQVAWLEMRLFAQVAETFRRAAALGCMPGRLGLVFGPLDPPGPLMLDIPVPLQAGLLPLAVLCRHPGQPSVFALADLFLGGVRPAEFLSAHPQIACLPYLALARALVRKDDGDDDHDGDKDP
jgi:hypothetical protein